MVEHAAHNRGVAGSIPATATISAVRAIRAGGLIPPGQRILVALSGGSDSIALLLGLRGLGADIVAAHYDHALRPGSAADAETVRRLCGDLGVDLVAERRSRPLPKGSIEAAARELRYEFLERARRQAEGGLIATAHTADDQVEGAVLHLLRGCGLAGARGLPATSGLVVRPLLEAWRRDLRQELAAAGIRWLEDEMNRDLSFARARVRHELLPRLERDRPGITARIHGAARAAAVLTDRLERDAALRHEGPQASVQALLASTPAVRREVLRRLYVAAGGAQPGLNRRHLETMDHLVAARRTGATLDLPGRIRFELHRDLAIAVKGPRTSLREPANERGIIGATNLQENPPP